MAIRNSFIHKTGLLALFVLFGIGASSATSTSNLDSDSPYFLSRTFDADDELDDSFLAELFDDMTTDFDDDLDWEAFLEAEDFDDEELQETLFGAQSQVMPIGENTDLKLLSLNETVYDHVKEASEWTKQVKVTTSQLNQGAVILGNVWNRSLQEETHPTGMEIYTERPNIEKGEARVAVSKAVLKNKETLEFGLPKEADQHPLGDSPLDTWTRSQVFAPVAKEPTEPFRLIAENKIEPFDHEAARINQLVYESQKQEAEDLIAQADVPPIENPKEKLFPPPSEEKFIKTDDGQEIKIDEPKENTEKVLEEKPDEPSAPPTFLIKFNNVKMSEYIGFVSKITGKNFVFDPADLDFKVTIVSNEPTTIENIISALLQELRFRGLNLVEVGNSIIIHRQLDINSPAKVIPEGQTAPSNLEIVTQVYRIKSADPITVATIIRPMMSASAVIEPVSETGHLIVTGLRSNIARITDLIDNIDSPDSGLEIGQYQSKNLPITRAITIAKELIAPIAKERPVVFTPLTDKNVVYVVTTPSLLSQVISIFEKIDSNEDLPATRFDMDSRGKSIYRPELIDKEKILDERERKLQKELLKARKRIVPTGPVGSVENTKFYIHKLQYRKGDQIQQALQAVATSLQDFTDANEDVDMISTINSVQWIESTNSLIFTGTAPSLEKIKELIEELDTALPQVLIEILVLEATVEDSLQFGVDWGTRFGELNAAGSQAFLGENSTLPAALDSTIPTSNINAANLARTQGFNLGVIGRIVSKGGCDFTSMGAIVKAIHVDRRIDVLLNPRIVVEDNTPAEFFVGINTPFLTQSIANEFGNVITGNFEFRDVGSTIKITPLIGNNGIITLDIEQEISSPVASNSLLLGNTTGTATSVTAEGTIVPVSTGGATGGQSQIGPTTRKSTTKTRVHMPDGYFLILSGQIRDEKDYTRTQVPCIGGLPWIGSFFSMKQNRLDKKNLMIFIRPQIVDIERINPITKRQQDVWKERKRERKRWEYEVDEALRWFNVKEPYCAPEDRVIRE